MTNHIRLQTFVPYHIARWVRETASSQNESISIFIRDILVASYLLREADKNALLTAGEKDRESVFASVALDAILTAHPGSSLRQKPHDAYARRLARLGLQSTSSNGGRDEA
mgnify:FL=1